MSADFLQVTIPVGASDPAPLEDVLFELGALSVTLKDAADDPVLEPKPGETPLWPTVVVQAVFAADTDADALGKALSALFAGDGTSDAAPAATFERIADRAWEREWLRDFRPMRFGRRLWVCPAGLDAPDPEAIRIDLDPGLAFGTGTHPTTAMCLEWLEGLDFAGRHVLDYGCGSGILAIAALKLGAAAVHAVDIDPQALLATRENAERNGVLDGLTVTAEPQLAPASTDVLVANILAGPLVELAPVFAAAVRPGGALALAGLLTSQAEAVTAAYRPCFDIACTATREEWALLTGRRRAD